MSKWTVIDDPALGELARELRQAVASGRMRWDDAMDAMKQAIRRAIDAKAYVINDLPRA
jgi:ABC-type glycerol-3-phosphate transport system substrate-binding protein